MKLEINYSKKMKRPTNPWRLNNMLLNNQWINDQIKTDQAMQNLWYAARAALRGKYIAIEACLRKEEKPDMNSLNSQLTKLEKVEQMRPKVSRRGT